MKPFSKTRRRLAAVILALGLSTFFMPLFSVSPPVMGRSVWTAWNLASHVYAQRSPFADVSFTLGLSGVALVYVLMLCGLVAIVLPRPKKVLVAIAVFGSIAGYDPFYWGHSMFARWLFRSAGMKIGAVQYEPGIYMLIPIMPALLYVLLSRNWTLDNE
jgi:hypothetical protein